MAIKLPCDSAVVVVIAGDAVPHPKAVPQLVQRAGQGPNAAGADRGPGGLPKLLPGLNLIYGLGGPSHTLPLASSCSAPMSGSMSK